MKAIEALIQTLPSNDTNMLQTLVSKDARLFSKPLQDNKNLLVLVCEQGLLHTLNWVLAKLQGKLWELPCVYQDGGIALFCTISQRLELAGAQLWATALGWSQSDYAVLLQKALEERGSQMARISIGLGANPNQVGSNLRTPLWFAYDQQDWEMIKILAQCDANLEQTDAQGDTLLLRLIKDHHSDCALFLLTECAARVKVNTQNVAKESALSAIRERQTAIIGQLLEHPSINLEQIDRKGNTVLHVAVEAGYHALVEALLVKGAPVNLENQDGQTPLMFAYQKNDLEIMKSLIRAGADTAKTDADGNGLLLYAIKAHRVSLALFLIQETPQVNVNQVNKMGETALLVAIQQKQADSVKALLQHTQINLELANEQGNTVLHYAAAQGNEEIAQFLLKHGASIKVVNRDKKTPTDLAKDHGYVKSASLDATRISALKTRAVFATNSN